MFRLDADRKSPRPTRACPTARRPVLISTWRPARVAMISQVREPSIGSADHLDAVAFTTQAYRRVLATSKSVVNSPAQERGDLAVVA